MNGVAANQNHGFLAVSGAADISYHSIGPIATSVSQADRVSSHVSTPR
jgi:hypothetical protein